MSDAPTTSLPPAPEVEAAIIAQLREVYDPEIPVNIYELGLIYRLALTPTAAGYDVAIDMTLTAPNCPVAGEMPGMVREAVARVPDLADITVQLVWEPTWTRDRMSEAAKLELNLF